MGHKLIHSRRQLLVQRFKHFQQRRSEKLMHLPKSAFLCKGREFEVVSLNAKVSRNMIADHHEPPPLLFGKSLAACFLLREPSSKVGIDTLGEGDEFVFL